MPVTAFRRPPAAEVVMASRRWSLLVGLPVAVVAIGVALSSFRPGAEAGGRATLPPAGECAGSPIPRAPGGRPDTSAGTGSWWRMADRLDGGGALAGRQLTVGRNGGATQVIDLGIESAASGPVAGVVVAASDDGRQSRLRLVSAPDGCFVPFATSEEVVRGAILDPSDGSVLAHLVDRETRADLGTWRFTGDELDEPALVAPALPAGPVGLVWGTDLRLDPAGRQLAIQSCGEATCLVRVFDLRQPKRAPIVLQDDAGQGSLIGWSGSRLVTWASCPLLPCGVLRWDPASGAHETLHERADGAAVTADGRYLVVSTNARQGRTLRIELANDARFLVRGLAEGEVPFGAGVGASGGIQLAPDEIAVGAPGANPRSFRPSAAEVVP
jgi:hypothetical protein